MRKKKYLNEKRIGDIIKLYTISNMQTERERKRKGSRFPRLNSWGTRSGNVSKSSGKGKRTDVGDSSRSLMAN